MSSKPYWHETIKTQDDYKALCVPGYTIGELMRDYRQPSWCNYPGTLEGSMGCWSLFYLYVTAGRDYCKGCESSADFPVEREREGDPSPLAKATPKVP